MRFCSPAGAGGRNAVDRFRGRKGNSASPDLQVAARPGAASKRARWQEAAWTFPLPFYALRTRRATSNRSLLEVVGVFDGWCELEIVVVDDGSTDGNRRRPWKHFRTAIGRCVLRHADPCGQSLAVRSGVRAARADVVATLDGDGQNDPRISPGCGRSWRPPPGTLTFIW